ncbi:hypothetical protein RB195_008593 [Necator americanus]|uniref:Uncharacterized protein n=1 Tax=Necator americanus TaxID=51031 RepID=A0ABR1CR91_NECAM
MTTDLFAFNAHYEYFRLSLSSALIHRMRYAVRLSHHNCQTASPLIDSKACSTFDLILVLLVSIHQKLKKTIRYLSTLLMVPTLSHLSLLDMGNEVFEKEHGPMFYRKEKDP